MTKEQMDYAKKIKGKIEATEYEAWRGKIQIIG